MLIEWWLVEADAEALRVEFVEEDREALRRSALAAEGHHAGDPRLLGRRPRRNGWRVGRRVDDGSGRLSEDCREGEGREHGDADDGELGAGDQSAQREGDCGGHRDAALCPVDGRLGRC